MDDHREGNPFGQKRRFARRDRTKMPPEGA